MNEPILSPLSRSAMDRPSASIRLDAASAARPGALPMPALLDHWRAIVQRKWLVLAVASAVVVPVAFAVFLAPPIYEASTLIMVHQGKSRVVSIEDVYAGGSGNREYLLTQAELIKSRNVAERVVDKLDLATRPEFDPLRPPTGLAGAWSGVKQALGAILPGAKDDAAPRTREDIRDEVVRKFQRRLDVQLVRLSQLARIAFEAQDPALAANVANAVADAYIQADLDARYAMTLKANGWLTEQTAKLRENLQASERALQEFREKRGLLDKQTVAQGGQGRQLEVLTQRQVEARLRRSQAEQALAQLKVGGSESLPAVLADPVVARAREVRATARQKLAEVSERLGTSHPMYQAARAEQSAAERSVKDAVDAVASGIARELEVSRAMEDSVARSIAASQKAVQVYNRDEFELAAFERDVNTNRQLLETFHARLKETSATADLQSAAAMVMDPAVRPNEPVKPRKAEAIQLAALGGLLLGAVVAIYRHRMYQALGSVEAAETRLGHPVLAAMPKLSRRDAAHAAEVVAIKPDGSFGEAMRTLRTSLLLGSIDEPYSIIAVTSSVPGEGKSTVSFNLALSMSQTSKTLFIECDLRRPSLPGNRRSPNGLGLSDVIADRVEVSKCIFTPTGSTLDVLAAGAVPPDPLELLSSRRFATLLRTLAQQYESIVLDTPPVAVVSDAVVVASHATGIVFVVKADATPYRVALRSLVRLRSAETPVVGVVLNQMDFRKAEKYHGEYSATGTDDYSAPYGGGRHAEPR